MLVIWQGISMITTPITQIMITSYTISATTTIDRLEIVTRKQLIEDSIQLTTTIANQT